MSRARPRTRRGRPEPATEQSSSSPPPIPPPLPPGAVVNVPGRGEIFVRDTGDVAGPTIMLLHGWTASADLNWFPVFKPVSTLGRVLALDHRGHGRGMRTSGPFRLEDAADDVAALLRHLGVAPVVVVGYSMGGPISLLLWQRHPDVVAGLVLEATALEWRARWHERLLWRAMALFEWVLRLGANEGMVERFLHEQVKVRPDMEPYLPWLRGELRRADPRALADAGRALGRYDARAFAPTIDVPTHVVVTTRDRLVRPRKQRALARAIPGARVLELAADHDAPLARPEALADATVAAIAEVLAAMARRGAGAEAGLDGLAGVEGPAGAQLEKRRASSEA